jgi:methyltransferase (TIGR00027 family)
VAEIFLPPLAKLVLHVAPLRGIFLRQVAPPGSHGYVLARTQVFDELFRHALEAFFPQIVLLGAGFDTRALRFQDQNSGTAVFELDFPATQQPKRDILRRKGVPLPEALIFVPIDFDRESIYGALFKAGYQRGQRTLFLWEGVTMYLTAEAVDETLDFIQRESAPGSLVAFDYIYASVLRGEGKYHGERAIFRAVSRAGEVWTFALEEGEVADFLARRGFELAEHYTSEQLEESYLTADDGTRFGPINETHAIAVARVR